MLGKPCWVMKVFRGFVNILTRISAGYTVCSLTRNENWKRRSVKREIWVSTYQAEREREKLYWKQVFASVIFTSNLGRKFWKEISGINGMQSVLMNDSRLVIRLSNRLTLTRTFGAQGGGGWNCPPSTKMKEISAPSEWRLSKRWSFGAIRLCTKVKELTPRRVLFFNVHKVLE